MKLLHTKQGLLKRFTAMFLSMCCMLSMFPVAGAASSTDNSSSDSGGKSYRYIWLVSQPGFGIRIEQPTSGNTGVYFMNMQEEKELSQMDSSLLSVKSFCSYVVSNWCQTCLTMLKSDGISRLFNPAVSLSGTAGRRGWKQRR